MQMADSIKENARETWHLLSAGRLEPDGTFAAEAHIGADSPWFSGHFPNEPVLPGIALLAMVSDAVRRRQAEAGKNVRISNIRKVRFRLPIRPDSSLSIKLSFSEKDGVAVCQFRIALMGEPGETVCTGLMDAEPI
jgi:3-hydroxymyristoyl/3-hydroxydecanoyl-(acyl carrier protein) dehydratase